MHELIAAGVPAEGLHKIKPNQNSGVDKGGAALQGPPSTEELWEADNCWGRDDHSSLRIWPLVGVVLF